MSTKNRMDMHLLGFGVSARRRVAVALLIGLGPTAALVAGCGSDFKSCKGNRTCPPTGEGGEPGTVGSAGESSSKAGSSNAERGARGDSGGTASGTGTSESGADGGTGDTGVGGGPNQGNAGEASGGAEGSAEGVGTGGTMNGMAGLGGVAGTAGSAGSAGTGGGTTVDTKRPTVVSVSPVNNSKGVASDATITVTWSEPMDKAAAQASFQCPDLAGKVTFEWPSATVMKVVPVDPLVYAEGEHAALATLAAKVYAITLNASAEDQAGNALTSAYSFKFSTLRKIEHTVRVSDIYRVYTDGTLWKETEQSDCNARIGDNNANHYSRVFLGFPLTDVPADVKRFVSATISAMPWQVVGNPFPRMGPLVVDHTNELTIAASSLFAPALRSAGILTSNGLLDVKTLDVTIAVAEDYAERAKRQSRSQFRLAFTKQTDNDGTPDAISFYCDDDVHPTALTMSYLVP